MRAPRYRWPGVLRWCGERGRSRDPFRLPKCLRFNLERDVIDQEDGVRIARAGRARDQLQRQVLAPPWRDVEPVAPALIGAGDRHTARDDVDDGLAVTRVARAQANLEEIGRAHV